MSACAVGTVKSVGKGTVCDEMLSQLKEVASSLLKRQGVVFSASAKLPGSLQKEGLQEEAMESASSDAKKKDLEQMRSALEENTSVVKELLAAHSRATTLVQELNSEVKDTKWQLQEMQEADERGRASINEKLKEFHRNVEDLQEQLKEAMDDFFEHVTETGGKATKQRRRRSERRTHRGREEKGGGSNREGRRGKKEEDQGDQPEDQGTSKGEGDGRIRVPARLHAGMEGVLRRWSDLQVAPRDSREDLDRP